MIKTKQTKDRHTKKASSSNSTPVQVARFRRNGGAAPKARSLKRDASDRDREDRIMMTVVVDAYDSSERAVGWFSYLENEIEFPFTARCATKRAISPLLVGDEVDVTGMAPADECEAEIFVMIRWEHGGLGVPLSQLSPVHASGPTAVAVADWHYWVTRGYRF